MDDKQRLLMQIQQLHALVQARDMTACKVAVEDIYAAYRAVEDLDFRKKIIKDILHIIDVVTQEQRTEGERLSTLHTDIYFLQQTFAEEGITV